MNSPSKMAKTPLHTRTNFLALYDIDNNDVNEAFYNVVGPDLLMKVIEAKASRTCPPDAEYIVISDSDDEPEKKSITPVKQPVMQPSPPKVTQPIELVVQQQPASIANESVEPKNPEPTHEKLDSTYDEDDDLPLSRYVEKARKSESDTTSDESDDDTAFSNWCICDNSRSTINSKMCDVCRQWYHVDCVCDDKTRQKILSGQKISLISDFKCVICRNDKEMIKKFDSKVIEQRKKVAAKHLERSSQTDSSSEGETNRSKNRTLADELQDYDTSSDEEEAKVKKSVYKKTYEEKKDAIKERLKEQTHTKLLGATESNDKSRQLAKSKQHLKPAEKASPKPKPAAPKILAQDRKKYETLTNQIQNKSNPSSGQNQKSKISITQATKPKQPELVRSNSTPKPSPSERKTKFIPSPMHQKPQPTVTKKISDVNSTREETKCLLRKSFEARLVDCDDLKISLTVLENLCSKIEEEMHNAYPSAAEYKNRLRIIRMNINEKNNKTFFRKILTGKIKPEQLPTLDKQEMKDDDLRRQDDERIQQDLKGRIQQSNEFNEQMRKKQEALKLRKGIDDDLSTLGIFSGTNEAAIDVNNNKKSEDKVEIPVQKDTTNEHESHQFDVGCKICTGVVPAPVKSSLPPAPSVNQKMAPAPPINQKSTSSPPVVNERKRKHDSDFESDGEFESQPKFNKLPSSKPTEDKHLLALKNSAPALPESLNNNVLNYSPPLISHTPPVIHRQFSLTETKMNSKDDIWSGTIILNSTEVKLQLKTKIKCLSDLSVATHLVKLMDNFKKLLNVNVITELNCTKINPIGNIWHDQAVNMRDVLVIKFEPNLSESSFIQPHLVSQFLPLESNVGLNTLFEKLKNQSYSLDVPKCLADVVEKFILVPLRKSLKQEPYDAHLKEKFAILTNRSNDSVLGFIVPKEAEKKRKELDEVENEVKKARVSPPQDKQTQARDPRIRKAPQEVNPVKPQDGKVPTNPMQEIEFGCHLNNFLKGVLDSVKNNNTQIEDELEKEIVSIAPKAQAETSAQNLDNNSDLNQDGHKVISFDIYKLKRKKLNDRPENVEEPMVTERSEPEPEPVLESVYEFFSEFLKTIASQLPFDQEKLSKILNEFKEMSFLKELTPEEKAKLRDQYEHVLPEFVDIMLKSGEEKVKSSSEELYDPFQAESDSLQEVSSNSESNKSTICEKMPLPPKDQWQGSSKESFIGLLKVHKLSKERQQKGLSYDITFESKNWEIDEKSFKTLDESLLGLDAKDIPTNKPVDSEIEKENTNDSDTVFKKTDNKKEHKYRSNHSSDTDSSSSGSEKHKKPRHESRPYESFNVKTKSTARKSCSGISGNIPKFKVRDDRNSDNESDSDKYSKMSSGRRYDLQRYGGSRHHKSRFSDSRH